MNPDPNSQNNLPLSEDQNPKTQIEILQLNLSAKDAEIDRLRKRIKVLETERSICAQNKELHPECRIWLVMNHMLKSKHRFRRDGR